MKKRWLVIIGVVSLLAIIGLSGCSASAVETPTSPPTTPSVEEPSPKPVPMPPGTMKRASREESQRIAEEFLRNSPTFVFDGIEDTLELVATNQGVCPYCWQFVFEFQCQHAGYGNRADQILLDVITPHTASITVEQGEVISAIMDDQWDMIKQKMIEKDSTGLPEPKPIQIVNREEMGSQ